MDESDDEPGGKKDAGKPKDAGVGKDARVDAKTPPPDDDDDTDSAVPRQPLQLDECGDDNAAGLSKDNIEMLKAGGSSDGMRLLYPYDGTVFPRGLGAPMLMWDGPGAQVYVHIEADAFQYDGCVKADQAGRLQLPQTAWDGAEQQTLGKSTPFTITLSTLDGKTVHGPLTLKVIIARASLNGSIYYNTYNNTGLVGGGTLGGSVERIKPGSEAEFFSRTAECKGCHSVSANGKRMITKEVLGLQPGYVFSLDTDTQPDPAPLRTVSNGSFVGITPDGSAYLTTGYQGGIGPPTEGALPVPGNLDSILYETDTGNELTNSGFPRTALMPTFSPDGTLAVFNDYARGNGRGLSLMDYDLTGRKAANERDIYSTTEGFPGWPFLMPDNNAVVFTVGESGQFSGGGAFITPVIRRGPRSDLMMLDMETGTATLLARAMGFADAKAAAADDSYLPYGDEEMHMSYYPTVSPVASGGYFWVFFDSIRHWGNHELARQLWGTAVEIKRHEVGEFGGEAGLYTADFSSPAFYLPGQTPNTANHRAFTALDPCLADGASCETGVDCCSGFCTDGVCGPPKLCSETQDACKTNDDCCNDKDSCIAGYCGTVVL